MRTAHRVPGLCLAATCTLASPLVTLQEGVRLSV